MDTISTQEQVRRAAIATHARRLILDNLPVQDSDETALLLLHEGFYLKCSAAARKRRSVAMRNW
ncbi:MAG: hypothetical protein LBS96_07710 [Oscillospiraceae bacterium]|jgi:hypothetical protein|nr:hypothetical protein [Oscillospiraceae bacterium]